MSRLHKPLICVALLLVAWLIGWRWVTRQRKSMQAREDLAMVRLAIESYVLESNGYPDSTKSATEILTLLKTPMFNRSGPVLLHLWQGQGEIPKDPWGRDYCMIPGSQERPPIFYSSGPNGRDEGGRAGTDDVIDPKTVDPSYPPPQPAWLKK